MRFFFNVSRTFFVCLTCSRCHAIGGFALSDILRCTSYALIQTSRETYSHFLVPVNISVGIFSLLKNHRCITSARKVHSAARVLYALCYNNFVIMQVMQRRGQQRVAHRAATYVT